MPQKLQENAGYPRPPRLDGDFHRYPPIMNLICSKLCGVYIEKNWYFLVTHHTKAQNSFAIFMFVIIFIINCCDKNLFHKIALFPFFSSSV
jgi:hypothetical protein